VLGAAANMLVLRSSLLLVLLGVLTVHVGLVSAKCSNRLRMSVVAQNCRQRGDNSFCTFTRGQDTGIKFRFIPAKPYRSLKAKVEGKVGLLPIWVPMPGSEVLTEACKDTRGATQGCPLVAGGQYEYNAQIPVSKNFPSSRQVGDVKVKYQLFGEDNQGREEVVACFEPTVRIQ